ncbi:unnamed protein product, partial [Trichogramma brassicae]
MFRRVKFTYIHVSEKSRGLIYSRRVKFTYIHSSIHVYPQFRLFLSHATPTKRLRSNPDLKYSIGRKRKLCFRGNQYKQAPSTDRVINARQRSAAESNNPRLKAASRRKILPLSDEQSQAGSAQFRLILCSKNNISAMNFSITQCEVILFTKERRALPATQPDHRDQPSPNQPRSLSPTSRGHFSRRPAENRTADGATLQRIPPLNERRAGPPKINTLI